jgi:hypothetical protein
MDRKDRRCAGWMIAETLVCRWPHGVPLWRAASRNGLLVNLAERAVWWRNPIAEILWPSRQMPTRGSTSAGPFDRRQLHTSTAQPERGWKCSSLATPATKAFLRLGLSFAFCAFYVLPTVFPFLRAHEPNLPGRASIRNLAGEIIKKTFLPPEESARANLVHQFTNRRMRIFITTPSARKVNKTEDPP